jgi:type IV secretion system protein VirB1
MDPAFLALAQQCAQAAPVETLAAIAQIESGLNPFAIRLNSVRPGSPGIARQPTSIAEATAKAKVLLAAGNDVDVGLMGLPATVLSNYGTTIEQAFNPCVSLQIAGSRLRLYGQAAEKRGLAKPKADEEAIAAYFGDGDPEVGREAGYLFRILRARAALQRRVATLTISPSERPLPSRQGGAAEPTDSIAAGSRDPARPAPARLRPEPADPETQAVADAPSWDVYRTVQQRGTTLLVFGRGGQR